MASAAAKTALEVAETSLAALPQKNFKAGAKKVYLPQFTVTFVRPKENQSPYHATFVVPLTFNKLDLRDYLWHAYNVRVTAVRSMVNQRALEKKGEEGDSGRRTYRPQSQKMMYAVLEKPFVWPEKVANENLPDEYDYERWQRQLKFTENSMYTREVRKEGEIELFTELGREPRGRQKLRDEAEALLKGERQWSNDVRLDERWDALMGDVKAGRK